MENVKPRNTRKIVKRHVLNVQMTDARSRMCGKQKNAKKEEVL